MELDRSYCSAACRSASSLPLMNRSQSEILKMKTQGREQQVEALIVGVADGHPFPTKLDR